MGLMQKLLYVIEESHSGVHSMCETLGSLPSAGERERDRREKTITVAISISYLDGGTIPQIYV